MQCSMPLVTQMIVQKKIFQMLLSLIPYLFSPHESMYYIKAVLANLNILDDLKGRSGKQREASCCRQKPRLLEVSRISSQLSPGKFWPWQPSRETQTTSSRPPRLPTLLCFVHEVKEAWLVFHLVPPWRTPGGWGVAGGDRACVGGVGGN